MRSLSLAPRAWSSARRWRLPISPRAALPGSIPSPLSDMSDDAALLQPVNDDDRFAVRLQDCVLQTRGDGYPLFPAGLISDDAAARGLLCWQSMQHLS